MTGSEPTRPEQVTPRERGGSTFLWLLVTAGGLGLAPRAPGTVGTLGGVILAVPVLLLVEDVVPQAGLLAVLAGVLLVAGSMTTAFTERAFQVKDPSAFVLDEVVGYLVAVALIVPFWTGGPSLLLLVAFGLFRVFDILKPWPVGPAERLPGAVGIMADDVVAGLIAGGLGIGVAYAL